MNDALIGRLDDFVERLLDDADCGETASGDTSKSEDSPGKPATLGERVAILKSVVGYLEARSKLVGSAPPAADGKKPSPDQGREPQIVTLQRTLAARTRRR